MREKRSRPCHTPQKRVYSTLASSLAGANSALARGPRGVNKFWSETLCFVQALPRDQFSPDVLQLVPELPQPSRHWTSPSKKAAYFYFMSSPRALNTVELYQLHISLVSFYFFDNIVLHFIHLFRLIITGTPGTNSPQGCLSLDKH